MANQFYKLPKEKITAEPEGKKVIFGILLLVPGFKLLPKIERPKLFLRND